MKYLSVFIIMILSLSVAYAQKDDLSSESQDLDTIVDEDKIFKEVKEMPVFPGCKNEKSYKSRFDCGNVQLVKFISKNLKYPKIARKNKVEGRVYVQFVVNKDGTVSDINIVRDIGYECGDAVKDVIKAMNKKYRWAPGKHEGKAVRVLFTLPIDFKL